MTTETLAESMARQYSDKGELRICAGNHVVSLRAHSFAMLSVFIGIALCILQSACTHPAINNLVTDSELKYPAQLWTLSGSMHVRPGVGPDGSAAVYYPGTGAASGFDNTAVFRASVAPGQTYTFSAYLDATDHRGSPPYIFLVAANGNWSGASGYQPGKGRISFSFTIPLAAGTDLIRGYFTPQDGVYPSDRGAIFSQPLLELGKVAHEYEASPPVKLDRALSLAPRRWRLYGRMHVARTRGGSDVLEYLGTGERSGFSNAASFDVDVEPGFTYTFACSVRLRRFSGTPPYVFISARNGRWSGTSAYLLHGDRILSAFTIPRNSSTTAVRILLTPQDGLYPLGERLIFSQPELRAWLCEGVCNWAR